MEYLILFGILFVLAVVYVIRSILAEKAAKKRLERSLYEDYGKREEKRYPVGRLDSMKSRFLKTAEEEGGFFLDEITASDLELDKLFSAMDRCLCSAGEEELYRLLRTPCFDAEELAERKRLITYFRQNPKDRVGLELEYAAIGRSGRFCARDYLELAEELPQKSMALSIGIIAVMALSVLASFWFPMQGFFVLIVCLIYNFVTYFKEKDRISPYITSFAYFLRLLLSAERIEKLKIEGIEEICKDMGKARASFAGFARFSSFLTRQDAMSGSPSDIMMEYLRMGLHLNIIKFYGMLRTVRENKDKLLFLLTSLGYIEAMISAGEFAESLPCFCFSIPSKTAEGKIEAVDMIHPLLKDPVPNGLSTARPVLLTGSNASGKSTFLKTVAICQVLSQAFALAPAKRFESGFYRLFSSMSLRDDLIGGKSYFMVEIEALKRILDGAGEPEGTEGEKKEKQPPVMCFVDEVLRGTNTMERISASAQILLSLQEKGVFAFAATHDLELTELLKEHYDNYHFEEVIKQDDIIFSYQLKEGSARSKNAIRLLSLMGYDESITRRATKRAETFQETGEWKL